MSVESEKRIVVADQQDRAPRAVQEILENAGCRVFRAITANQAVRWAEAEEPDLVVVHMDSSCAYPIEVIGALRDNSRTRAIPIGIVSPSGRPGDLAACLEVGADHYLGSPADEALFTAGVNAALRLRRQSNELRRLSITDELTGLYNRRFFLRRLDEEIARAERHGISLVCIMIDVDAFKSVNDTYGHHVGDWVLKELAGIFGENIRKSDIIARHGGDEFIILLSHNTVRGATILAEYLRKSVESHSFERNELLLNLTISLGLSSYPDDKMSPSGHDLIRHADLALYDAKSRGRNMFRVFGESSYTHAAGLYDGQPEG